LAEALAGIAQVECYAGSRALETPRAFLLGGVRYAVTRILARHREGTLDGRTCERFRVVADGRIWVLVCDPARGVWTARGER